MQLTIQNKFWYHDKIGEVFIVTDSESGLLKVDETSCILPEDCIPLEDHRESQLDKLI